MNRKFTIILTLALIFTIFLVQVKASFAEGTQEDFTKLMLQWRDKSELAQDYLRQAEDELKNGLKYKACGKQQQASKYGVEAFEALIMAQKINDIEKEVGNIELQIDKWKRLSRCSTVNSLFN